MPAAKRSNAGLAAASWPMRLEASINSTVAHGTVNALIDEPERQAYASQIEERLASVIAERRRAMPELGLTGLFAADPCFHAQRDDA